MSWEAAEIFAKIFISKHPPKNAGLIPKTQQSIARKFMFVVKEIEEAKISAVNKNDNYSLIIDETPDDFSPFGVMKTLYATNINEKPVLADITFKDTAVNNSKVKFRLR